MSNVARKFSHTGPSQGALPLADRGRRIYRKKRNTAADGNQQAAKKTLKHSLDHARLAVKSVLRS